MLVFVEGVGKEGEPCKKTFSARMKTNNKLNPGSFWWEVSTFTYEQIKVQVSVQKFFVSETPSLHCIWIACIMVISCFWYPQVVNYSDNRKSLMLADFGLATEVKSPMFLVCGTPTYVAPEILDETGYVLNNEFVSICRCYFIIANKSKLWIF